MKITALFAALLSLLPAEPVDDRRLEVRARRPAGRAIEGVDFYVWDEDPAEAERWAGVLAAAPRAHRPPRS